MNCLRKTLVFDFGSANTVVCKNGQVVFDEATLVSVWPEGHFDVGEDARKLLCGEKMGFWGKWNAGECNRTLFPVSCGYVTDWRAFGLYVKGVLKKVAWFPRFCSVLIAIPDDWYDNENYHRSYLAPFRERGVKDIKFIPQSVAACRTLDLPSSQHNLIVDIGYGKTRVSLVKDSRVVKTKVLSAVSGEAWISSIKGYLRSGHNLNMGKITSEWLLISVGAANEDITDIPDPCSVAGPNVMTAHPHRVTIGHKELSAVLNPSLQLLKAGLDEFIKEELMTISDEVKKDIISNGLWLIGGGSRLRGLSDRLRDTLNLPVHTADNPFHLIAKCL